MVCNTCGRVIKNEEANFCDYCGAPVHGRNGFDMNSSTVPPAYEISGVDYKDKPISFLNWLATLLLINIPIVGWILLLIWAFGRNVEPSKKNWARAYLILVLIAFIILRLLLYSIGTDFTGLLNYLYGNSTNYYNVY